MVQETIIKNPSGPPASMPPLITLLTDFGTSDTYVGQMKGAILSICPSAHLVDLNHEITPGAIDAASRMWADAVGVFPAGTVHLGVVDPGVGSSRRAIAVECGPWRFVCPDNGLLSHILQNWPVQRAVALTDPRWWRNEVASVFHGRDIFGPVAAQWAHGTEITEFGPLISDALITLPTEQPVIDGSTIEGIVEQIDRFGNLITNLSGDLFADRSTAWSFRIGPHEVRGLSRFYGEQPSGIFLAIIGSHGRLELAVSQGDAAGRIGATMGTKVYAIKQRQGNS